MSQRVLRILTTMMTGLLTLGLLVGATYLYNKIVYTNPLEASVAQMSSIGSFKVEQFNSRSKIKVQFNIREKLRTNFYQLLDQLEGMSAKDLNDLTIEIENAENKELRDFLTDARLPVYEVISTGNFTGLPAKLDEIKQNTGIEYELEIDNSYIFITAYSGDAAAHMVIDRGNSMPLIINTMGGEYL